MKGPIRGWTVWRSRVWLDPMNAISPFLRLCLRSLFQVAWAGAWACGAVAQTDAATAPAAPVLKPSSLLPPLLPPQSRVALPLFIQADHVSGRPDLDLLLLGNVQLRRADTLIRAERIDYFQPTDTARARGRVRINQAGNVFEGPDLDLKIESFEGSISEPRYQLLRSQGHGQARRVDFLSEKRAVIHQGNYTSCARKPGPSWMPDWLISADKLTLDSESGDAEVQNGALYFKDTAVVRVPSFSFPMTSQRRSGFLPPTIETNSVDGLTYSQPYYWNLAPNRDVLITPRLMSSRGLNLSTEFRYLESVLPPVQGTAKLDLMPDDRLTGNTRWGAAWQHQGQLDTRSARLGPMNLGLNISRVSDDNYWKDFPRNNVNGALRLLPADATLGYARGGLTSQLRTLRWQTLQDASAPITPPYDLVPKLGAQYRWAYPSGLDVVLLGEMTRFQSNREFLGLSNENGQRMVSQVQAAQSWITPYGSVTPKLMLHARSYQFDQTLAATGVRSASVVIPSYSVDAGAVFERPTQLFAKDWVQTLEPRIFYVNTPFKDQNSLPNYDSASYDFNIATIFTENAFTGYDRISDSHQVTTGATSRFLDPRSGAERARLVLAQRYRLRAQEVVLPGGTAATEQLSDTLAGTQFQLANAWSLDSALQYSPDAMRFVRSTVAGRYRPGPYRVLNLAYRYKADAVGAAGGEFVDTSWQWPLQNLLSGGGSADSDLGAAPGRWYTVGRLNYNQQESRLVDALMGLEYDAGCWLTRIALDRYQLTADRSVQRVMFQMEFSGMSRVGSNITGVFKDYVPRYQNLRDYGGFPSRFGQYE